MMTPHTEPARPEHARTLDDAARNAGGAELADKAGFQFETALLAAKAAAELQADILEPLPVALHQRLTVLRPGKHGWLVAEVAKEDGDQVPGWREHKKMWTRIFPVPCDQRTIDEQISEFDDRLRLVVAQGADCSERWFLRHDDGSWVGSRDTSLMKAALITWGFKDPESVVGLCVRFPWILDNIPFGPEFPGGRIWNRRAARLLHEPTAGVHPHWDQVLGHIGRGLDPALASLEWAQRHGIDGRRYLTLWIACLVRFPFEPLPFLGLIGEQNSGKSIFHEMIKECLFGPDEAVASADRALTSGFNNEIARAIVCFVEEADLSRNGGEVYNRIKDWVTARQIPIRALYRDQVMIPNKTHWVQCSNHLKHLPIFPGDSRITLIFVPALMDEIPKSVLLERLREEGPAFTHTLLSIEIPPPTGRLYIPVIETSIKAQSINEQNPVAHFVADACTLSPESSVDKDDLFREWQAWCEANDREAVAKESFSRKLLNLFPSITTGRRSRAEGQRTCYHGIALKSTEE
ncbi:MAG TPA: primase-helicase family protein [Planctomycetaceae bacterium]|jgi:hypothetical protein